MRHSLVVHCLRRPALDLAIPATDLQERPWPLRGSNSSSLWPGFLPWWTQRIPERIRCQHANLSHIHRCSPTHTSAAV